MRRSEPGKAKDLPFDLPLDAPGAVPRPSTESQVQPELPLEADQAPAVDAPEKPPEPEAGLFGRRCAAGVLDLAVHLAVLASAVAGSWWLGVPLDGLSILPLVLFAASFSFVYHVVPLTFWGHTPGLASVGLVARAQDGGALTISQAVQRWLGAALNVLSLGLAFLLSRKRSLADVLSRSAVG